MNYNGIMWGVGQITTEINAEMAIGAAGPGYYKARDAIETLKHSEQKSKTQAADIRIEIESDDHSIAIMLNAIFSLIAVIQNNWFRRHREIVWAFEKCGGSQLECARQLNVPQSSVQRSLAKGNFYAYKNAKETINTVLKEIGEVRV